MVYGVNGKPNDPQYNPNNGAGMISKDAGDSRTLNAQNAMSGRNANGYPISAAEKNSLSKNSSKNIERYQKGSFV